LYLIEATINVQKSYVSIRHYISFQTQFITSLYIDLVHKKDASI